MSTRRGVFGLVVGAAGALVGKVPLPSFLPEVWAADVQQVAEVDAVFGKSLVPYAAFLLEDLAEAVVDEWGVVAFKPVLADKVLRAENVTAVGGVLHVPHPKNRA